MTRETPASALVGVQTVWPSISHPYTLTTGYARSTIDISVSMAEGDTRANSANVLTVAGSRST